jgi:M6 family metalloprotease-like protein
MAGRLLIPGLAVAALIVHGWPVQSTMAQTREQDPILHHFWEYPDTPAARARRAADPTAYRFSRALFSVARKARATREAIAAGRLSRAAAVASGSSTAVEGTYLFPVIVGAFAAPDSARPTGFTLNDLNNRLWSQNYSDATHINGSVRDYYEEVSYNRLHLSGHIYGYVQADSQVSHYVDQTGQEQAGFMDWFNQMISTVDATTDFSQYDGDEDGYVDTLVLVHNLVGAESQNVYSGTTGFWSHRWSYAGVNYDVTLGGTGSASPYITNDTDPFSPMNGNPTGKILINDYVIQPLVNSSETMIDIGVFAHELGHAFGLPDHYDTDGDASGGTSEGLGHWCLMATGSWRRSYSPAHISAWGKVDMGWVTPLLITDRDSLGIAIPNVVENEFIIKVHTSQMHAEEYYLIENRQQIGFDEHLYESGLLIYHINDQITTRNKNPADLRWAVEQADGRFDLENDSNRGDSGDPWPGVWDNRHFWFGSTPSSETRSGNDSYVDIILQSGSGSTMTIDIIATPAFTLTGPDDGSLLTVATPNLSWENYFPPPDWDTVNYEVQVDTTSSFATAMLDTTAATGLTWTGTLTENKTYYWQVRAFDDLGNSRLNSGGPRTLMVDATAPVLSLGALRNPILTDHLDIYLVATEVLDSYSLTVNGTALTLAGVSATDAFILVGDFTLVSTGTLSLHGEGADAAGNSDSVDAQLSVASVSAVATTDISSPDGIMTVRVPSGVVTQEGFAVVMQREDSERAFAGRILPSGLGGGSSDGRPVSPLYWIDIPNLIPGRNVEVTFRWTPGEILAGEMPTIWQQEGNRWAPLSTTVDLNSGTASVRIDRTGLLQLRSGGDRALNDSSTFSLEPAYPNPFNPSTKIAFTLPESGPIKLYILNTRGQTVRVLADASYPAGRHSLSWNGRDGTGRLAASGIYIYVLESRSGTRSRKMTLIR